MAFYTLVVTVGSFHLESLINQEELVLTLFLFSSTMQILAALSVLTSVLLIVGLCTDNRALIRPWLVVLTLTTMFDTITSCYMVIDGSDFNPFLMILIVTDFLLIVLNLYCLHCVGSYYLVLRRARARQRVIQRANVVDGPLPTIQLDPASPAPTPASPRVSVSVLPSARNSNLSQLSPNSAASRSSLSSTSQLSVSSTGSGRRRRRSFGSSRLSSSGSSRRGSTGSSRRSSSVGSRRSRSSSVGSRRGSSQQPAMSPVGEVPSPEETTGSETGSSSRFSLNGVLTSGLLRPIPTVEIPSPTPSSSELGFYGLQSNDVQL